jgi:hypothetical protein
VVAELSFGEALWKLFSDKDIFIAWLTTTGAVMVAVWGAVRFLDARELSHRQAAIADRERERDQIKDRFGAKVAGLERDLEITNKRTAGGAATIDTDFPALNELEPIDLPSKIQDDARHFDKFRVIALKETKGSAWSVEESSHEKVFNEWFGDSLWTHPLLKEGYQLVSEGAAQPCLLWKGTSEKIVSANPVIKRMYPFVIVRPVTYQPGTDPTTEELFNFMVWLRFFDKAVPGMRFKIHKMHRTEHEAYIRGYFQFEGLTVDHVHYPKYYLMRQVVIVKSDEHVYAIFTGFPNPDLNDPYFDHLKEWWRAFRIVK